jgi:hypothetical protein
MSELKNLTNWGKFIEEVGKVPMDVLRKASQVVHIGYTTYDTHIRNYCMRADVDKFRRAELIIQNEMKRRIKCQKNLRDMSGRKQLSCIKS